MNINDVAEAAGVSRGSVSNYLNNKKVSDKIKLKIEAAIKELNYIPNSSARDLRSKESKFVVFIIPTVWSPFFSELTYYIQNELNSSGYKMILCISDSDFNKEKEYIELATSQKAAGIISISYSQMNDFVRPGMPLVSIEKEPTGRFSMVSSDNYEGGKLAAQKLIEKGAEILIYIGEKVIYSDAMSARKSGFVDYCNLNHVPYEIVEVSSIKNYENVKKDILSFLDENYNRILKSKIGCFTSTDDYGYLLLNASNSLKISVPENLQIIGFDGGKRIISEMPTMSSIRQPVDLIAKESVQLLTKLINKETNEISRVYLPISFYEGDTTC